ncbi:assimilatory sulfite reductase (NADPH) flavoprotein subunit [Benzoatithermus flavus]|uniref:Sulfite reductase [NADPH] flavoprotein alpha-component n=1 Tax=Benzoatithermus flavus TaxID=3108223 RepID=A0ABU8XNG2_9PROT
MLVTKPDASSQTWTGPLSPEQAAQLEALVGTLTAEQALWVSGYLAGYNARARVAAPATAVVPTAQPVTILYASETGNAASLAKKLNERAKAKGLATKLLDIADYRVKDLKGERFLVVVTSTQGEGEPPTSAADFYEFLHGRKAPRLEGLKFAVLGLGDSTYEHFCQTGKDIDTRLEALGAVRMVERVDCDVDYEAPATGWIDRLLDQLVRELPPAEAKIVAFPHVAAPAVAAEPLYDRTNPFQATVLENLRLTGRGSSKEIRHVEISLEGSGLTYEPGDSLGILPQNDPELVGELIASLGLEGRPDLQEALGRDYEITTLTGRFLAGWAELSGAKALKELVADPAAQKAWLHGREIIDVVSAFPVPGIDAATFTGLLRKLPPRLYSLASSQAANPDEAHIVVSTVRYDSHGRSRKGVASTMLADRVRPDDTLPVYINANRHFRLPTDPDAPIVMIGAGTGVAPYRAFMQEREERGAKGRSWLFFGERNFRTDFLYQVEWQRWLKDGVLSRIDLAFSRDQAEKVYVQHRLLERAAELWAWLEEGAHLYLCGDAEQLAPDVHAALLRIVAEQSGRGPEQAAEYLKTLQREGRYQRDVY